MAPWMLRRTPKPLLLPPDPSFAPAVHQAILPWLQPRDPVSLLPSALGREALCTLGPGSLLSEAKPEPSLHTLSA